MKIGTYGNSRTCCYVMTALGSCVAIVLAYAAYEWLFFGRPFDWARRNFWVTIFWLAIPVPFTLPTIHVPVFRALRRWRGRCSPVWLFLLTGMVLEMAPTALATMFYLGDIRKLFAAGAVRFHVVYSVASLVLAAGFIWCQRCDGSLRTRGFEPIARG